MSETTTKSGFKLLTESSTPAVVGKAWWNESLQLAKGGDVRRVMIGVVGAFVAMQVVSGVCGVVGMGMNALSSGGGDSTQRSRQRALAMQQQHGWTFGAADEAFALQFAGERNAPGSLRDVVARMPAALAPRNPALAPSYVPTLFQAATATPTAPTSADLRGGNTETALADVLPVINSPAMQAASTDARWLKELLGKQWSDVAVVVDLAGAASVAFAAEVADRFDPVFCFDNWPHPRGVVPAHETLAAAATLTPVFEALKTARTGQEPPMFVLDRNRLSPYVDQENTFDNRSLARLPSAETLTRLGIKHVFYIAPNVSNPVDLDDVNADLVAWAAAGLDVRTIDFSEWYSVDADADVLFAQRYNLYTAKPKTPPPDQTPASSWRPQPRQTAFARTGTEHTVPVGFGEVPVVVAASGAVLGAVLYRSGTWNRTTSYSGGG